MNNRPKKTAEEMREYKRSWAREHTGLKGILKNYKNQNTDKTHCVRGHEFTKDNTYMKGERRVCRVCVRIASAARDQRDMKDPDKREALRQRRRKAQLKKVGWTVERFDKKWEEQEGKCAICRKPLSRKIEHSDRNKKAHADHEHVVPPKPRGLLCGNCNCGIGNLQENIEVMEAAIAYVRQYKGE